MSGAEPDSGLDRKGRTRLSNKVVRVVRTWPDGTVEWLRLAAGCTIQTRRQLKFYTLWARGAGEAERARDMVRGRECGGGGLT